MANTDYYNLLQRGLPDSRRIARFVHGVAWTAAVLDDGRCGVAMHTEGDTVPRMFDHLEGLPLKEAGKALLSWNMEEASEALAAVNAWYNSADCGCLQPEARTLDGIDLAGRTVGMVGKMLGHSNMREEDFAGCKAFYVMDRECKPGALPDSACEFVLPLCDLVIITGSAAINKTLPRLLELSRGAEIVLCGPSVSCCRALPALGLRRLNGRVITEKEAMLRAITEKRCSVNPFSIPFQLDGGI